MVQRLHYRRDEVGVRPSQPVVSVRTVTIPFGIDDRPFLNLSVDSISTVSLRRGHAMKTVRKPVRFSIKPNGHWRKHYAR
jgi:hypothetical protein